MLSEQIIRAFSLPKAQVKKELEGDQANVYGPNGNELNLLWNEYPDLEQMVHNKRVVDFGCGLGAQSLALAEAGAEYVLGLDINQSYIKSANELKANIAEKSYSNVCFSVDGHHIDEGQFDLVISQNSMEHFTDPEKVLKRMKELINPNGRILITFGPLWFSPYGSHMHFFCKIPWLNVLFSEKAVMAVRNEHRDDGANRYTEVESGLNKMTLRKFENLIHALSLRPTFSRYRCVKGLDSVSKTPLLRELFVNRVSVVLEDCSPDK